MTARARSRRSGVRSTCPLDPGGPGGPGGPDGLDGEVGLGAARVLHDQAEVVVAAELARLDRRRPGLPVDIRCELEDALGRIVAALLPPPDLLLDPATDAAARRLLTASCYQRRSDDEAC